MTIPNMAFTPSTGLNDPAYSKQTPDSEADIRREIQGVSDQLRDYINNTLKPQMIALNIPITAISDLDGTDLQNILQSVRNKLKSVTDSSSGADYINATNIDGLVGSTVQALMEALKGYVDTHKTSNDHDLKYYSKDQLQSITSGSSGADIIKATPINANSGNTVQQQLAWLLAQIAIAATGTLPDGSINEVKLSSLLVAKINTALSNTGLLATLITVDKSSLVNAVNEVVTSLAASTKFQTATGNQWSITLALPALLYDGYSVTFIANASSTSGNVFINTIPFYKPGTTIAPTFIAGKAYTVWYNTAGNCFFIKASAEGDVVASQVLAGKKFSNDNDTGLVGTMPNIGDNWQSGTLTVGNGYLKMLPPMGFYKGTGECQVVSLQPDLIAINILAGKTICEIAGEIPRLGSEEYPGWRRGTVGESSINTRVHLKIPKGAYLEGLPSDADSVGVFCDEPNFIASNLLAGKTYLGLAGTAKRKANGTGAVANASGNLVISGLTFLPRSVTVRPGTAGFTWVCTENAPTTSYRLEALNNFPSSLSNGGFSVGIGIPNQAGLSWWADE